MDLKLLVEEYLFDCQARNLSPRTVSAYRKQLQYFLTYLERVHNVNSLEELKPAHIKQYIVVLQNRKNKPSYINDLIKPVKCLCTYAFQEKYIDEIISKRVKNVKEPKVLIHTFSTKEIKALIEYFDGSNFLSIRNRLMLMILFDTGIRITELLTLRKEQIRDGYFAIYGKGRKERIVPLNPSVSKWLIKYEAARDSYFSFRDKEEYFFLSKNGKKLTDEAVSKFMKTAAKAVGVNPLVRVSPHTCRHTFAHQELINGLDLYSLSRVLGHESVNITQRYLEAINNSHVIQSTKKAGVLSHL